MNKEQFTLICQAYKNMLCVSHNDPARHTASYQSTLAGLRDCIAEVTEWEPEFIQNTYEEIARSAP